jgi:DNA-binding transcriptional LysR family regulator
VADEKRRSRDSYAHRRPAVFNTIDLILDAALDDHGPAYLRFDQVTAHFDDRRLVHILPNSTPDLPGDHLYYPNRRFSPSAVRRLVEMLRYRTA